MSSKTATSVFALSLLALPRLALSADVHGGGEGTVKGTVMGPVAFLWPADRPWSESQDNIGPCGSSAPITNRTQFPLSSTGSIELTIADEAFDVAIRIAFGNNPVIQDAFKAIKGNVSEIEPGHKFYGIPNAASTVAAGSNATIQLKYWANDSNKNESFFACSDITFIEAALFTTRVPCFNVTSSDFVAPCNTADSTTAIGVSQATASASNTDSHSSDRGLSNGVKAGIAVGSLIGAAIIIAGLFVVGRRRRRSAKDAEAVQRPAMTKDTASFTSGETSQRN